MRNIITFSLFLSFTLSLISCNDMLDSESETALTSEKIFSSEESSRTMLNSVYRHFCEDGYTTRMGTNWAQNNDIEVGSVAINQATGSDRRALWALYPGQWSDLQDAWSNGFSAINYANMCIEGIENSSLKDTPAMKQMLGEAKCLRAYWYWLMTMYWADIPFATHPTSDAYPNNGPRVDKDSIYTYCIKDLISCEEDMQWASDAEDGLGTEYMTRDFALGWICKLAMFRAGYSMQKDGTMKRPDDYQDYYNIAIEYGEKLVSENRHSLSDNFQQIFDNEINEHNPANGEVLYEIGYYPLAGGDICYVLGINSDKKASEESVVGLSTGQCGTYTTMTPYYAASFFPNDTRLNSTCAFYYWVADGRQYQKDGSAIQPGKWDRTKLNRTDIANKGTGVDFPVLRYSDVLLLLAEAYCETGNTSKAEHYLQMVHEKRAPGTWTDLMSKYSLRDAIRMERAWEFGGEMTRKFDLIRWNAYADAIVDNLKWTIAAGQNYAQLVWDPANQQFYKPTAKADIPAIDKTTTAANLVCFDYTDGKLTRVSPLNCYVDNSKNGDYKAYTASLAKTAVTGLDDEGKLVEITKANGKYKMNFMSGTYFTNTKVTRTDGGTVYTPKDAILAAYYGFTKDVLKTGGEDLEQLRNKVVPYVLPIPSARINASNGVLSNDGYLIRQ